MRFSREQPVGSARPGVIVALGPPETKPTFVKMTDRSGALSRSTGSRDDAGDLASLWKREVKMRMVEWGMVDPSTTRKGYGRDVSDEDSNEAVSKEFWDGMVAFCQQAARGEVETRTASSVNLPEMLPVDPVAAIRVVLDQEIRALQSDDGMVDVTDTLSEHGVPSYLPPYWYDPDKGTKGLKFTYKHARIPSHELHPLVRFQFKRVNAKDQLESQYVTQGTPDSVAYRAIVAHGACLYGACVQCSSKQVRWNGYFDNGSVEYRYWKKLVCEHCGSVYEIKSARTVEEAMRKFNTRIEGGNFLDEYAVVQQELREASYGSNEEGDEGTSVARQFVAMLVTDETVQQDGKECWPVYIAAVDHVVPLLKDRSFERGENRRPKVYARIFFDTSSSSSASADAGTLWFHVPVFEYDAKEMASDIVASL